MVFINYIVDNYVLLFELIGLLIMLKISSHVTRANKRYTLLVICLLFLESLVSSFELWTQTFDHFVVARPLLTYTKYTIYPVILFLLMQITVEKTTSTKKILLYLIPEFICIPIFYSSQWTKLVSYFDEENHYHGGVLNYLPYVLFGFYMILFLINNIIYFKHHARIVKRIVIYIVAGSVIGIALYMTFLYEYDFTDIFTAAIVLYYLCFYIHLAKIDPLTSLLNRQSYYQDILLYDDDITGVVSIDMNELKITNDTYGHEAGDTALREISRVMRENCGKKGSVYRIGGDEFVILYCNATEEEIKDAINNIHKKMDETPYSCAYGYEMRDKKEDIEAIVRISDEKMYNDKALQKKLRS